MLNLAPPERIWRQSCSDRIRPYLERANLLILPRHASSLLRAHSARAVRARAQIPPEVLDLAAQGVRCTAEYRFVPLRALLGGHLSPVETLESWAYHSSDRIERFLGGREVILKAIVGELQEPILKCANVRLQRRVWLQSPGPVVEEASLEQGLA